MQIHSSAQQRRLKEGVSAVTVQAKTCALSINNELHVMSLDF